MRPETRGTKRAGLPDQQLLRTVGLLEVEEFPPLSWNNHPLWVERLMTGDDLGEKLVGNRCYRLVMCCGPGGPFSISDMLRCAAAPRIDHIGGGFRLD